MKIKITSRLLLGVLALLICAPDLSAQAPVITTGSLRIGVVNISYSQTLVATGGVSNIWSVVSGSLPTGLSLGPQSGVISGTPSVIGTSNFRVRVTAQGLFSDKDFSITINPLPTFTTTSSLTVATVGAPYSETLTGSGGVPPYYWTMVSGSLPIGLGISGPTISGTPTAAGTATFTMELADSNVPIPLTTRKTFTLVVSVAPPVITTSSLPTATVGAAYNQTLAFTGGVPPYSWSILSGSLPAGLTLNGPAISGTPNTPGSSNVTIRLADGSTPPQTTQKSLTFLVVVGPLTITTSSPLPVAAVGAPYTQTLTASGGVTPINWSIGSGGLPAGLSLNGATISGTPAGAGITSFTVHAADSGTPQQTADKAFTVTVTSPLTITTSSPLSTGSVGASYSQSLAASGGTGPYSWSIAAGSLPTGLTLTGATISGAPSTPGNSSFAVRVTDAGIPQQVAEKTLTLLVVSSLTITTSSPLPTATIGVTYSQNLTATGGNSNYVFSVFAGALPSGISLTPAGTLAGNPSTPGSFNFTVRVTDTSNPQQNAQQAFVLVVVMPLIILTESPLTPAVLGSPYSQAITAAGGVPEYRWGLAGGQLPAGMALSGAGSISGTPAATGVFNFSVQVTDSAFPARTVTKFFDLRVDSGLSITTASLPTAVLGMPYSRQLTASQTPVVWSLASGNVPSGLTLSDGGLISGTPTATGVFGFTVQIAGGAPAQTATRAFQISVTQALTITTPPALPAGMPLSPYTLALQASGGAPPYAWSIISGVLPRNLQLSGAGVIGGAAIESGTFVFTAQVTDTGGAIGSQEFTISIEQGLLKIRTENLPGGIQNYAYNQQLEATGGPTPYTWAIVSGSLPPGLALTPAGALQGTPTAVGSSNFQVRVTDSSGVSDTHDFSIAVGPPIGALSLIGVQGTENPAQQLPLGLSLAEASPVAISGTLSIAFKPAAAAPADDPAVQFSTGGRTLTFTFPPNSTSAVLPSQSMLLTGTVAGVITITGGIQNGPLSMPVASVEVRSLAPQMTSVTGSRVSGGLRVQIIGYSTERRVTNAEFSFDIRATDGTQRVSLSRPVEVDFDAWYQSPESLPFGGTFLFEQVFSVQGDANAIDAVTITLTNGLGSTTSSRAAVSTN